MKELLKRNRGFILLTSIAIMFVSLTSMLVPLLLQIFAQSGKEQNANLIFWVFVAMLCSYFVQIAVMMYRENFSAKFNTENLSHLLYKMMKMPYDSYVNLQPTYLAGRIFAAVDALYLFLLSGLSNLVNAVLMIILSLILIAMISYPMALILLLLVPLNVLGFRWINQRLSTKMSLMQQSFAAAQKDLMATLSNSELIKSQANTKLLDEAILPKMRRMYQTLARTNQFAQASSKTIDFANKLAQNIIYISGSMLVVQRELSIYSLVMMSILMPIFFSYLREISQVNLDFSTLSASNRFVKEELLSEEDGDVSIQNIDSIRLDNPKSKINDKEISFDIQTELNRGDRLYLSGASGAGKSTLLKMLLKFRRSEGIFVNKLPIASIANDSLRARIAYLSQDVSLLSLSLEENIAFGRKMTNEEKQVVEQSKILETVFRDKGWDTVLVENGANLSGGEKQRIAVARLLLMDFDICILDEVTSNIDEESSDAIFEILERICRDKIMIFTSHNPNNERFASKKIILRRNA